MKKFIVLDVEGYSTCAPYDIGFIVADKSGNIYEEHSCAIMPSIIPNWEYRVKHLYNKGLEIAHSMANKNITEILNDNINKYEKFYSIEEFYNFFIQILFKYDIKRIWAYNCAFDKGALKRLFEITHFDLIEKSIEFCDITPAILHTHLLNKKYIDFCKTNGYITEKGNIQTKAEIVYRYLTNTNFEEEHTGLSDCKIELEILLKAMEKAKSPKRKPRQAWKILKEFCKINEINI